MARKPDYVAIAETLRKGIEDRTYKPGDRLPAERELVSEFDVARMTIRHALDLLQMEGLIDRKRGRTGGTFVRAVPPMLELTKIDGVDAQLDSLEIAHSHETLSQGVVSAPHPVATAFKINSGDDVFRAEVLRYISGVPGILETIFVPLEYADIAQHLDHSLIDALANKLGADVDKREDVIVPGAATDAERSRLEVTSAAQVLRITRTTHLRNDDIVAFSYVAIRPDVAQVKVVTARD